MGEIEQILDTRSGGQQITAPYLQISKEGSYYVQEEDTSSSFPAFAAKTIRIIQDGYATSQRDSAITAPSQRVTEMRRTSFYRPHAIRRTSAFTTVMGNRMAPMPSMVSRPVE